MKFSWVGLLLTTTALATSGAAMAQQKTMYVAGYGGSFEQTMRKEILPVFEKQANVKIEYVAGNSTDTLAKLQAQKGNQQIDVAIVDDGPAYQAVALGFCGTLTDGPVYKDVAPVMKFKSNKGVGLGLVATGLFYNTKIFAENNWPAPTSWNDLKSKTYGKKIVTPPINNTYGLHALIAMAQIGGGGETNIEPGFKTFKDEINPGHLSAGTVDGAEYVLPFALDLSMLFWNKELFAEAGLDPEKAPATLEEFAEAAMAVQALNKPDTSYAHLGTNSPFTTKAPPAMAAAAR